MSKGSYTTMDSPLVIDTSLNFQQFNEDTTAVPDVVGEPLYQNINPEVASETPTVQHSIWNIAFYKRLFDVDTDEVLNRLKYSFVPQGNFFTNCINSKPDFYGPIWICVTLVFVTAVAGNIADYFRTPPDDVYDWKYDFHKISFALTLVVLYVWVLPGLLWALLRWFGRENTNLKLTEIITLYGYCMAIFVPLSPLWLIPSKWFRWTSTITGSALSGVVLIKSLLPMFSSKMLPLLIILFLLHMVMASVFMVYFYIGTGGPLPSSHDHAFNSSSLT